MEKWHYYLIGFGFFFRFWFCQSLSFIDFFCATFYFLALKRKDFIFQYFSYVIRINIIMYWYIISLHSINWSVLDIINRYAQMISILWRSKNLDNFYFFFFNKLASFFLFWFIYLFSLLLFYLFPFPLHLKLTITDAIDKCDDIETDTNTINSHLIRILLVTTQNQKKMAFS